MTAGGDERLRVERGSVWRFLSAQASSSIGQLALNTLVGKQVYDLTGSELALGLLGLVEFLPSLLLVLVTGTLADRVDRRRMASVALGAEALAVLGLAAYAATDPTSVLPIFFLVTSFGLSRAFAAPAMRSMPADLVPPVQLPWLTVRYSGTWQVAAVIGPVLGGLLYVIHPAVPFVVVGGLLLGAATAVGTVRYAPHVRQPSDARDRGTTPTSVRGQLHEALEGYRFSRREPVLLGAITLDLVAVLFGGAVALLPALAEERLGVGAVGLGWLRAAVGIGAGLMTIGLAVRPLRRHIGVTLLAAVAMFGVGTAVLGATTSFAVAFAALAVAAAADAISVYIRATLVPLLTPDEMRGRVLAMEMVLIGGSNELGAFESGVAGQVLGPALAVVLGGVVSVATAVGWWFGFPDLRRTDRFPRTGETTGPAVRPAPDPG